MQFESLRDYIQALESANQLKRVKAKVSVDLEIAEILRRMMYRKKEAVLFENVDGFDMKVLGNAFGSIERMKIALGMERFEEIGERIVELMRMEIPSNIFDKIKTLPRLSEITNVAPKIVNKGPIMENIVEPNLLKLPAIKSWPKDGGRFITFGIVVSKHPETNVRNLGVYRIQIIDEKRAIVHWHIHKRSAQHYLMRKEKGEKMEVAVVIGADPATVFSSIAPVPEGLDKYLFAGIIRKKGIRLVRCNTIDLEVPAEAEIVLEGIVDPNDLTLEGPFGDHTGYYTPPEPYPILHLTKMMYRDEPIYLTTVVGKPIVEDAYIGKAIERAFLPLIRLFHPEVVDFSMPPAGWFQGLVVVSIKKSYPGQAKKVMLGLWGLGQLALTKIIIVVDHDINVHDMNDVIWAVTTRVDPQRDIIIINNTPTDTLDPASPLTNLGSKLGIDATQKWKEEGYIREVQELAVVDEITKTLVDKRWKEYNLD